MLRWAPKHQFSKSLKDFLVKVPSVFCGAPKLPPVAPQVPFIVRVGAAGPLALRGAREELEGVARAILAALKRYTEVANREFHRRLFANDEPPPPSFRFVSQLASGFDQLAASVALVEGYSLHVVLPGDRGAFAEDIRRNLVNEKLVVTSTATPLTGVAITGGDDPESVTGALARFERLIAAAERVLELDPDDVSGTSAGFTARDYAQAGAVILGHSDLVLVAVHDEEHPALGGTRWIANSAAERDLPVIEIPVDRPLAAILAWTVEGRREQRSLFPGRSQEIDGSIFAAALNERLLGPEFDLFKTRLGEPERRFVGQLSLARNESFWDQRWDLGPKAPPAVPYLGQARQQIDADLRTAKSWADLRASTMAELVRGSFIFSALLGVVAVFGALLGILFPARVVGIFGKVLELLGLGAIIWLALRSRRSDWRSHWLSHRQLERYLDQAAWLVLLGRSRIYVTPSHLAQFQTDDVAKWTNAYFHALVRRLSFPTAHLTDDYLNTVHSLALRNLVEDQISYFKGEAEFQHKSDEVLQRSVWICVIVAAAVTFLFLIYAVAPVDHVWETRASNLAGALGALFTATAGALAAVRSQGEYAQIAAQYEATLEALESVKAQLERHLPDHSRDTATARLRSAWLARTIGEATEHLIGEVQGWRAILQRKEIEPT